MVRERGDPEELERAQNSQTGPEKMRRREQGWERSGGGFVQRTKARGQAIPPSHPDSIPHHRAAILPKMGGERRVFQELLEPSTPPRALESREVILVGWEVKRLPLSGAQGQRDKAQAAVWSPWGTRLGQGCSSGVVSEGRKAPEQTSKALSPNHPAYQRGEQAGWSRLPRPQPSWEPGTSLHPPPQLWALHSAQTQTFKLGHLRNFKGDAFGGTAPNNTLFK